MLSTKKLKVPLVPLLSEEEDLLSRNSTKVKNDSPSWVKEDWLKLGKEGSSGWVKRPTFAEKLQGINHVVQDTGVVDVVDDLSDDSINCDKDDGRPLCEISENPNRNFPTFAFSEKMKKRLYKAWNCAVIVKLLGKSIGYKMMLSILQPLWAKKGVIRLINIGNEFYVVKLTKRDDYFHMLNGGP
ncbi:hypothetical protein QN277_005261 [Acacia crassicarpa]|uniref:DUF4283 domain-containing protein n=1 Tax=Acacia crassicarpa TaxID=499986 RepID=A0AAE1IVZ1_9FABA|nr:hypothetical protein QN277_005261 [Acacia crassicarpa]